MKKQSELRVALYARVSGKVQEDKATVETQVEIMERWCRDKGYRIVKRYIDRKRCRNIIPMHLRPEGGRLLEDCSKGYFDAVLVAFNDRISRDRRVADPVMAVFEENDIRYYSATENSDLETEEGRLVYDIHMAVGGFEGAKIKRRTAEGRETWLRQRYQDSDGNWWHYWMGGKTPYGWKSIEVNRRRGLALDTTPIPGLDVSPVDVRRNMYDWLIQERLSLRRITERLNARGIPKHSYLPEGRGHVRPEKRLGGTEWFQSCVQQMITSPLSKGVHIWGVQRADGSEPVIRDIPPIVDAATWALAQERLRQNHCRSGRGAPGRYLLRGKIHCGWCPCVYCGKPSFGNRTQEGRWYYICQGYNDAKRLLHHRGIQSCGSKRLTNEVEEIVWADIVEFLKRPDECVEQIRLQIHGRQDMVAHLKRQIRELQVRREKAETAIRNTMKAWDEGDISQKLMAGRVREKEDEIALLDSEIDILEVERASHEMAEAKLDHTRAFLHHLGKEAEAAQSWGWERRRKFVEYLVDEIWVRPGDDGGVRLEVIYTFDDPDMVHLLPVQAGDEASVPSYTTSGTERHGTRVLLLTRSYSLAIAA